MAKDRILQLRARLTGLHSQSAAWAWFLTIGSGAAYGLAFLGAVFAASLWVQILCALALGPLIALLFRIAHDAGHGSHLADAHIAALIGQLSQFPSYHPYSIWLLLHNRRHHAFTNLRDRDYIWIPLSQAEYDGLPRFQQWLERCYRTIPGMGLYYLYAIWWRKMAMPSRAFLRKDKAEYRRDRILVLIFFLGQLAILALAAPSVADFAWRFTCAIALPFVVFCWLVGFASFLNHTHPEVPWFARRDEWSFYTGQVNCTVHMKVPPWMVFFLTDVGLHGAHHIDPRIPIWGLETAEPRIVAAARGEIIFEQWTLKRHREILRRCQIYDYDGHRWHDFAGHPTAPHILALGWRNNIALSAEPEASQAAVAG